MRAIHCLMHVPFETPGMIESWAKGKNYQLTFTRFYEDVRLPDTASFDWLVIMGGPMSVNDEDKFSWLKAEKKFISDAINKGKVVIGICLGAQLIANVLGGEVYLNPVKEIGWLPVKTSIHVNDHELFSSFPRAFDAFHWHGETFDLPKGALHLAETDGCMNQLFVVNEKVVGFQFHLEVTETLLKEMVQHGKAELKPDKYVQSADEILERAELITQCNSLMESFLNNLDDLA